jgi:hypothetical protein
VQTVSVITTVAIAVWYVRGTYEEVLAGQREIKRQLTEMRDDLDTRYVTQEQADRYAASYRWENRSLNLVVPEPKLFR